MKCILCMRKASMERQGYYLCTEHYVKARKSPIEDISDFVDVELGVMMVEKDKIIEKKKELK